MRISKKILAFLMAALMVFAMMPLTAFAETIGIAQPIITPAYDDYDVFDEEGFFEALTVLDDGEIIVLQSNLTISSSTSVSRDIRIDLNGYTITSSATLFNCYGNHDIELYDTKGTGAIDVTAGKAIYMSGGKLTLNGGAISVHSTSTYTYGVQIGSSGSFEMNGGSITIPASSTSTYNYCVNNSGTTVINGGELTAQGSGGNYAVNSSGTITINGGSARADASRAGWGYSPYVLYFTGGTANVTGGYFYALGDRDWEKAGNLIYKGSSSLSVTGGYFGGDYYYGLSDSYFASGYGVITLTNNEADPTDAAAKTAGYKFKAVKFVAKIGTKGYATLDAAVTAANEGDTITLVSDVDTSVAHNGQNEFYYYDISGVTLDLDGYTLTEKTYSIAFIGVGGTIKNGTIDCVPDSYNRYYFSIGCDCDANPMLTTDNIVLEDLTVNAGIHVSECSNVVAKDCDVTGKNYYAVWGDPAGTLVIEGGTYSSTNGAALFGTLSAPYDDSYITVKSGNFNVPNTKKLVVEPGSAYIAPQNVTIKGGFYHYDNGNVYTVLGRNLAASCVQDSETGEVFQFEANTGASITVAENISANFYIDNDYYEETYSDQEITATVSYNKNSNESETVNNVVEDIDLSELQTFNSSGSAYDGAKKLSVLQAPAQSTEPIVVTVYADGEQVDKVTYSVYNYCMEIINDTTGTYDDEKDLAKATLDYAAAAQTYFNYNTENMATQDAGDAFYSDEIATINLVEEVSDTVTKPSCIKGSTVIVKSELEVKFISTTPISASSISIDTEKGGDKVSVVNEAVNGYYIVRVKGIEAANMDNEITVVTDEGNIVFTANAIMKAMSKSVDSNLATLAKAMYLYGVAANDYFA